MSCFGLAARRRHDVDLLVAVVLAGEGDPLPVGGEAGEELHPGMGGQAGGRPSGGRGDPDVAGVGEGDLVAVDRGEAKELGLRRRGKDAASRAMAMTAPKKRADFRLRIMADASLNRMEIRICGFRGESILRFGTSNSVPEFGI